jgi:hypothetical protein
MVNDNLCEVCNKEEALCVACIPGIPMSVAYGRNCIDNYAHPVWAIRANILCCGGVEEVNQAYLNTLVYSEENEYITIEEELKRRPFTEKELKSLDEYYSSYDNQVE